MGRPQKLKHKYKGKLMTLGELESFSAVSLDVLGWRLANGWLIEDALKQPKTNPGKRQKICVPPLKDINYESRDFESGSIQKTTDEKLKRGETLRKLDLLREKKELESLDDY